MLSTKKYGIREALAVLCASVCALGTTSFFVGIVCANIIIDSPTPSPPSSTSVLGVLLIFYIPMYIGSGGAVGGMLGFVLGVILSYIFRLKTISQRKVVCFGIISAAVMMLVAGFAGYSINRKFIEYDKVGLIYTNGCIEKRIVPQRTVTNDIESLEVSYGDPISLSFQDMTLHISDWKVCVVNSEGDIINKTRLYFFDYILEVKPIEVRLFPNEKSYLAILAKLRATSNRTMLLIYSPRGELAYQEILERNRHGVKMSIDKSDTSTLEALIVQSKDGTFLYTSQVEANQ